MRLNKIIQRDYTSFSLYYQIKLPLDLEISIPSDDPVRLVSVFVEEMDLSELYKTYGRIRKNQATPRQMLKLVIYAAMNRIYSSRDIRKACKRDINFMYLLEGMPAPDDATIARFISLHFSACAKVLLAQMSDLLYCPAAHSGRHEPHAIFSRSAYPIVPCRDLPHFSPGMAARCRSTLSSQSI